MSTLVRSRPLRWSVEALALAIPAGAVLLSKAPLEAPFWTALFACAVLPLRHRWPRTVLVLCLPALVGGMGWPPTVVALYKVGWARPHFWWLVCWVLVTGLSALLPVLISESLGFGSLLVTVSFVFFTAGSPTAVGALVRTRRQLAASLARLREVSAAEAFAKAESARADERARIAREIHDAVGHHATLIAVEAAALASTTEEPHTAESAGRLRALAREALSEMRTTLGLAGADSSPHPASVRAIPDLISRARDSGVNVRSCELPDEDGGMAPAVERAAYRVVQEALTNASKHAPGAEVTVRFDTDERSVRITVLNGAPLERGVDTSRGGSGLAGLSERVRMAGGHLEASPLSTGEFRLRAVLPKAAVTAANS